tara:strand:+ start:70 stop:312 length:243 start_codon:yes stop_codon:yes gene_type:complete
MNKGQFESFEKIIKTLKEKRKVKRLSLRDVAEGMKTSSSALSRLESYKDNDPSKTKPNYGTLCRYAKVVGYKLTMKLEVE